MRKILKVFLHPPSSERESFVRWVGLKIPKTNFLSIAKRNCENYLLITDLFTEFVKSLLRKFSAASEGGRQRMSLRRKPESGTIEKTGFLLSQE